MGSVADERECGYIMEKPVIRQRLSSTQTAHPAEPGAGSLSFDAHLCVLMRGV